MAGQRGDELCDDGGSKAEEKSRGQNRLKESCGGHHSPQWTVVLMTMIKK